MPTIQPIWSIRRICLISMVGAILFLSIFSISVITQQFTKSYNDSAADQIKHWANVLANESLNYVANSERNALIDNFSLPEYIPNLNYLHIYQLASETEKLNLFYSFKRNKQRAGISEKSNEIANLQIPQFKEKYIEYMQPIKVKERIIGYIYLQSSNEQITQITDKLLITSIILVFIIFIIAIIIALQFERYISAPFLLCLTPFKPLLVKKTFNNNVKLCHTVKLIF